MAQPLRTLGSAKKLIKKKIKVEGLVYPYVHALFAKPPNFIFDRKILVTCKQFTKVYDLNNTRPCPRMLSCEREQMSPREFFQEHLSNIKYYLTRRTKYLVTMEEYFAMCHG
jgi:hypothetical protein